nr:hypothetical protein [Tanacetum cinerariifolium]
MEDEVPNRRDDVNDFEDYAQEDGELPDLPTFCATDEFASNSEQVEKNIDIAEEKEEVPMKEVEMDKNHNIDHSGIEEALQWSFVNDPFLDVMELINHSSFFLHTIPSFISNEVEVCRVMLGRNLATGKHFKFRLVGYHPKHDDGIFVIIDVAQGSRLRAWLRAWTLYKPSRGWE